MHPLKKVQIAYLKVDEAPLEVFSKYADIVDVFSPKLATKLPKYTNINDHASKLVDNQQPLYSLIYSLGPVELEILKAYIKNNLAHGFIRPSKFHFRVPIFFDKKPDKSLELYVDYQDFNNLTIKNQYPLLLVGKLLDWLSRAWYFIQLDLTNLYYQIRIREGDK